MRLTHLAIGDTAPDFTLSRDDGTTITLSALKGAPVVLYFYPKDNTTGCTTENLDFTALAPEFAQRGAVLIGISPDTIATHQKFRAKHAITQPLAADPDRTTIEAYGIWQLKKLYGKESMGVVRTSFIISAEGKIAAIVKAPKVAGHAQKVLDQLDAHLATL